MPIIEEWTAWLLVRERDRDLIRREHVREAERTRAAQPASARLTRRPRRIRREDTPAGRRAA